MADERLIVEFWDVGQGDCSVIRIGPKRVVLIDVGPLGSPITTWLLRNREIEVERIVLTHSHEDHAGAVPSIIDAAAGRIDTVFFLQDGQPKDRRFAALFSKLNAACKAGAVKHLRRLEAPFIVWEDPKYKAVLEIKFPFYADNVEEQSSPNRTSGVLSLSIGGKVKIIWAGDSLIESVARECSGTLPDYLIGPHHGAPEDRNHKEAEDWLRSIGASINFLSVGSNNTYKHPQKSYMRKSIHAGSAIQCSQLTKLCDPERKKDVIQSHARLALPPPNTGISCRGPVRLVLNGMDLITDDLDDQHRSAINELERPQCIRLHR
jgi:beta-lactamase superfamily II metal-dependent hydrolase